MRIVYAFRRTTFYPDPGREGDLPPKEVRGAFLRKVKEIGFEGLELAVPRTGEDAWSARAPLETDPTVSGPHERPARRARPVGETALEHRILGEDCRRLCGERLIRTEPEQRKSVACGAVQGAQTAVVVVLPPETVLAATAAESRSRLTRRFLPARLAGQFAHGKGDEQRPRSAPADVVRRVRDVATDERRSPARQAAAGDLVQANDPGRGFINRRIGKNRGGFRAHASW